MAKLVGGQTERNVEYRVIPSYLSYEITINSSQLYLGNRIFLDDLVVQGSPARNLQLLVFSRNHFPLALEYPHGAISIFYTNSRIYSKVKIYHLCQRHFGEMIKILAGNFS
jgi:hypothetical protein